VNGETLSPGDGASTDEEKEPHFRAKTTRIFCCSTSTNIQTNKTKRKET